MTVLWFAASFMFGLALGLVYFTALWASVRRLTGRGGGWRSFAVGAALRAVFALGVLAALLWSGARAELLLVGLVGFVAARAVAIRVARPMDERR